MRIGICGLGRMGRATLRAAAARGAEIDLVAFVDIAAPEDVAYLLQYDSVRGQYPGLVRINAGELVFGKYQGIYAQSEVVPDWAGLGVELVVDATGKRAMRSAAEAHLMAGARRVIVTSPCEDADATLVIGYNEKQLSETDRIISSGSCTTNCLVPMLEVLHRHFGIESALVSTVHSYTSDQRLVDTYHKDQRRGRAAAINIIPTTTGAAVATGRVIAELAGRVDGCSFRVPVADVSLVDLTALVTKVPSVQDIVSIFVEEARQSRVLDARSGPIVSSDILGATASCIVDLEMTQTCGPLIRLVGWYDNEWGYANRLVDALELLTHLSCE